jgi:hypothetical protein
MQKNYFKIKLQIKLIINTIMTNHQLFKHKKHQKPTNYITLQDIVKVIDQLCINSFICHKM